MTYEKTLTNKSISAIYDYIIGYHTKYGQYV